MKQISEVGRVHFQGVLDDRNISGISLWNGRPLIVTDEAAKKHGNVAQIFEFRGNELSPMKGGRVALDKVSEKKKQAEMDLEGIAISGDSVFVLGSHSARRPRVDDKKLYKVNRGALTQSAELQPSRDVLLSFTLSKSGKAGMVQRTDLRTILEKEP